MKLALAIGHQKIKSMHLKAFYTPLREHLDLLVK